MKIKLDEDLFQICCEIIRDNHSESEWAGMESGDMFQRGRYNGGFDADNMFFAFSFDDDASVHWCFSLTLGDVIKIVRMEKTDVDIKRWDDLYKSFK